MDLFHSGLLQFVRFTCKLPLSNDVKRKMWDYVLLVMCGLRVECHASVPVRQVLSAFLSNNCYNTNDSCNQFNSYHNIFIWWYVVWSNWNDADNQLYCWKHRLEMYKVGSTVIYLFDWKQGKTASLALSNSVSLFLTSLVAISSFGKVTIDLYLSWFIFRQIWEWIDLLI